MSGELTATYIGPLPHLQGKRALLICRTRLTVLAQFEDKTLTRDPDDDRSRSLGYGWHSFPTAHFTEDPT